MHILVVLLEFAVVLGILVLVHEFGHFLAAKLCGVRVEIFSIGFPPRLFGVKYGDTDYRISLIPLGGYVKFAGDNPGGEFSDDPAAGEFNAQPRWKRVIIAFAGPFANFLLAFGLLTLVASQHHEVDKYLNGPAIVDYVPQNTPAARDGITPGDIILSFNGHQHPTWNQIFDECALNLHRDLPLTFEHDGKIESSTLNVDPGPGASGFSEDSILSIGLIPRMQAGAVSVYSVSANTPAQRAGLKAGDDLQKINNLYPHSVPTLLAYLKDQNGAPATLLVLRHGQPVTLQVTPEKLDNGAGDVQYRLGFTNRPVPVDVVKLPLGAAMKTSLKQNVADSTLVFRILKGMFTRHVSVRSLSGPVGIAQQIDLAAQLGIWTVLQLMSTISLQLGIFNLLPIPILDGGTILFLLVESIMRRDLNQEVKERVYQVAFVCLIVFAVFVMFNDITKLPHFGKP